LEKVAETMLRAASLARLPVMSPEARARVLQAREAVDSALRGGFDQGRWQMLQDYHLGT
jgi:glycerol-3-phosphate cytidylyltransferase-like family protein